MISDLKMEGGKGRLRSFHRKHMSGSSPPKLTPPSSSSAARPSPSTHGAGTLSGVSSDSCSSDRPSPSHSGADTPPCPGSAICSALPSPSTQHAAGDPSGVSSDRPSPSHQWCWYSSMSMFCHLLSLTITLYTACCWCSFRCEF